MQKLELTWIGKGQEPALEPRILLHDPSKDYGDPNANNMLIHGDNLLALKALEQEFAGRVKCIYIDPPYNADSLNEYYDDNLEHSEWLSRMVPRLRILRNLLSEDGSLWVSIDEKEGHYLKVVLDEIFGRNNFVIMTTIQRGAATGHKAINPTPVQVCDLMLTYAKHKDSWIYQPVYRARGYDKAYNQFIENFEQGYENWTFIPLSEAMEKYGFTLERKFNQFAERIIRFAQPDYKAVGQETRNLIDTSRTDDKVHLQQRENYPDIYLYKGNRILFYKDKLREIDGKLVTAELVTNLWDDMNYQGIAKEGGVTFARSKKPEAQVRRILEMSTKPGDLVLDSFLGSGTTAAVAHKMGRRWIGIELGDHCYTHCLPRLKAVVDGEQSGISKAVGWQGGGGFKFYELAPTLIVKDENGFEIISDKYDATMLAAAVAKLCGYRFAPREDNPYIHGVNNVGGFIFVTTQYITAPLLGEIAKHFSDTQSLVICASAFQVGIKNNFPNIKLRKIPQSVLSKCEYGADNYNLNVVELPDFEETEGDFEDAE
jgi:adenine-specific DNA-methyltransferase